jgi:hypothetical protein
MKAVSSFLKKTATQFTASSLNIMAGSTSNESLSTSPPLSPAEKDLIQKEKDRVYP